MTCKVCSLPHSVCRFPLSHGHATVDEVKLPSLITRAVSRGGYPHNMRLQDRNLLNSAALFPYGFETGLL